MWCTYVASPRGRPRGDASSPSPTSVMYPCSRAAATISALTSGGVRAWVSKTCSASPYRGDWRRDHAVVKPEQPWARYASQQVATTASPSSRRSHPYYPSCTLKADPCAQILLALVRVSDPNLRRWLVDEGGLLGHSNSRTPTFQAGSSVTRPAMSRCCTAPRSGRDHGRSRMRTSWPFGTPDWIPFQNPR